jgi:ubiquinone/menaquinone biosynthesis C-methylase UbiE
MKSNLEWKLWGERDPLFGVASWPGRERGGAQPWTDEEFYALGEDWNDFAQAWQRTVGFKAGTVLEIGSGAGRITRRLAEVFERVVATDVSPHMLQYARTRIANSNIAWQVSDGDTIPWADDAADAVFSCHVFQHFPDNAAQLQAFAEVRRVLKSGGTFFVHLPLHVFPQVNESFARFARFAYGAFLRITSMRAYLRRQLMRLGVKPYMHGVSYEAQALLAHLEKLGFTELNVLALKVRTGASIHYCVSGRK